MDDAPTCLWPLGAALGEGPVWDVRTHRLWFVDIKQGRVHSHNPATGAQITIEVGGAPSFVVPSDDGRFVVGRNHALERFDGHAVTGRVATIDMPAGNRLNDATVDRAGRLWFGSMDDGELLPSGRVYRYDRGELAEAGGDCVITNGPAISVDQRWLYHVDTVGGTIWRFALGGDPSLRDGTVFARIDPADGHPDGVVVDSADHLWVALWGGGQARRYAPDGRLVRTVRFPCSQVTKLAFGGADLRTAFVTTAAVGLDAAARAGEPLAGALFAFPVDVPGVALPAVRLGAVA